MRGLRVFQRKKVRGLRLFSRVKMSDLPAYVPINFDPSLSRFNTPCAGLAKDNDLLKFGP